MSYRKWVFRIVMMESPMGVKDFTFCWRHSLQALFVADALLRSSDVKSRLGEPYVGELPELRFRL